VAASAIGTIYTAILALAFGLSGANGTKIPPTILTIKGAIPALFLGLSIVLAAVYLSYITQAHSVQAPPSDVLPIELMFEERNTFIRWTTAAVLNRAQWLHSAVISLGLGVIFLPVAFLDINNIIVLIAVLLGLVAILLIPNRKFLRNAVWPMNSQEAANMFGGTPDRWELSSDESKWKLKPGDPVEVKTQGLLAGGYNGDPINECYTWVGTQTVRTATIYRDSFPSDASSLAESLTKDSESNPQHIQCTVRI